MTVTCNNCGKGFNRNDKINCAMAEAVGRDSRCICYACALTEITKGLAPEEGDFNSAHLISGEISDKDLGYLMEDLRAVEQGRSIVERYDDTDENWHDPAWCYTCNRDTAFCTCTHCPICGEYHEDCQCEEDE